jgi:cephalosporin hydroxylase
MGMHKEITGLNTLLAYIAEQKEIRGKYKSGLWSSLGEYAVLFTLVGVYRPDIIIECGTANGASALSWAVAQELCGIPIEVHTFDPVKRAKVYEGLSQEEWIRYYEESWVCETSAKILNTDKRKLIFIDGKHIFEPCIADTKHSVGFLNSGDILLLHDYTKADGVKQTVEVLKSEMDVDFIFIPTTAGIAVTVL